MSSMAQGSNDMACDKPQKSGKKSDKKNDKKSDKTRRNWTSKEEECLVATLKELVAQGWKSDNGFRSGYLNKLEEALKKEFPRTDLRVNPHITSKLTTMKKNYYSLQIILGKSGVGFNLNGDYMIDCDDEQWEQIIKRDPNARLMRGKPWPFWDAWTEVFGKDRANGEGAEDVLEAVHDLYRQENLANAGIGDDYHVDLEDNFTREEADDSVCQSEKAEELPKQVGKKRKVVDGMQGVCELLSQMHQDTNARLEKLSTRIGYEVDLGKARKEVFDLLGNIPGLSLDEKFDVCEILVDKVERLELFIGLPESARPQYVMRLLNSKGQ